MHNRTTIIDGVASFVQPIREEDTSKKKKPPLLSLFYIGDKLVHNCMIDSRANSLVMPKYVADGLGIQYEPMAKGIL